MARLIGGDLYDVRQAKIEGNHLVVEALAQFDFDRVHKSAAAPVIVAGNEGELLARVPAVDGKRSAAGKLSAAAFGDGIARQSQYCGKVGGRRVAFDHDRFSGGEDFPVRIGDAQRSRHRIRSHRGSVLKRNSAPDG